MDDDDDDDDDDDNDGAPNLTDHGTQFSRVASAWAQMQLRGLTTTFGLTG